MKITLNIVLECLSDYYCDNHITASLDKSYGHVRMLEAEAPEYDAETLYICTLSAALEHKRSHPELNYICLRDRFRRDDETDELLSGMVIVTENIDIMQLYSKVKDSYDAIAEWESDMWAAAAKGESLKRVLDMSCGIIGNTINVSDSSMRLIASTATGTDDPITLRLREAGCHPEENKELFRKTGCYDEWNTRQSVFSSIYPEMSRYVMVNKVFKFRDAYFMHVVMVCDHRPYTPGLLDLFMMLLEVLDTFIAKERSSIMMQSNTMEQLISDLIENDPEKHDSIKSRLYTVGIPYVGSFRVLTVASGQSKRPFIEQLKTGIKEIFPDAVTVIYQQRIVSLLRTADGGRQDEMAEKRKRLNSLLERDDCRCGVSMAFTSLSEFSREYSHATLALRYSSLYCEAGGLPDLRGRVESPRIWYYDVLSMYYPVSERLKSSTSWHDSPYWQAVSALYKSDLEHGTNNVEILYLYLRHERRGSAVAELLHMHRNNVAYRINRIQEQTGLDLEQPDVRFNLMIAILMLKTVNGHEML